VGGSSRWEPSATEGHKKCFGGKFVERKAAAWKLSPGFQPLESDSLAPHLSTLEADN
jgi:hypothetical protein